MRCGLALEGVTEFRRDQHNTPLDDVRLTLQSYPDRGECGDYQRQAGRQV